MMLGYSKGKLMKYSLSTTLHNISDAYPNDQNLQEM